MREAKASTPVLADSCHYFFKNPKVPYTHIQITSHLALGGPFGSDDTLEVFGVDSDGDLVPLTAELPLNAVANRCVTIDSFQGVGILITYTEDTTGVRVKFKCSFYTKPSTSDYVRTKSSYVVGEAPQSYHRGSEDPETPSWERDADNIGGSGLLNINAETDNWTAVNFADTDGDGFNSNSVTCVSEW